MLLLTAGSSPVQAALALAPGPVSFLVTPTVTSATRTVVPEVVTFAERLITSRNTPARFEWTDAVPRPS